jgi:hypothetical protein
MLASAGAHERTVALGLDDAVAIDQSGELEV